MIVLEATIPSTQIRKSFKNNASLINFGYKLAYFDGLNEYFVHDQHLDLFDSFATPISIFDQVKTLDYAVSHYILGENLNGFVDKSPHFTQAIFDFYGKSEIEEVKNANIDLANQTGDLRPWTLNQILAHRKDKFFEELHRLKDKNQESEEAIALQLDKFFEEIDQLEDKNQELEGAIALQLDELTEVRLTLKLLEESRIFRTTEPLRKVYFLVLKLGRVLKNPSNNSRRFFNWTLKQILIKMQLNPRFRLLIFSILPTSISTKLRIYVKRQLYKDVQHHNSSSDSQLSNLVLRAHNSSLHRTLYSIWTEK